MALSPMAALMRASSSPGFSGLEASMAASRAPALAMASGAGFFQNITLSAKLLSLCATSPNSSSTT